MKSILNDEKYEFLVEDILEITESNLTEPYKDKEWKRKVPMEDWHHRIINDIKIEPDDAKTIDEVKKFFISKTMDINFEFEFTRMKKK